MQFGQLKEYNVRDYEKNEAGRLVPDFFLFSQKALNQVKASSQHLSFNIF